MFSTGKKKYSFLMFFSLTSLRQRILIGAPEKPRRVIHFKVPTLRGHEAPPPRVPLRRGLLREPGEARRALGAEVEPAQLRVWVLRQGGDRVVAAPIADARAVGLDGGAASGDAQAVDPGAGRGGAAWV